MNFYEKFSEQCRKKGISPSKAAALIGISKSSVSVWKNTGSSPNFDTLSKISRFFSLSVDDFLSADEEKTEEIAKVALFGGDTEVTDEMWNEVKRYAEFIKGR